jgi:glycosyltransferase involved in cell wall biosynthesis
MQPLVSVIIPTYNSAKTLQECLTAVRSQSYKNIEIIIADSYSRDTTKSIARRFTDDKKIIDAESLAKARSRAVGLSKGEYILFLDSDQVLASETIERSVEACEKEGFDGVTHFEHSKIKNNTFVERLIDYDKWIFHSARDDDPIYGTAEPRFFRASFARKIDYLDNPPITFELAIINLKMHRMGAKIKFIDAPIYHYETPSFRDVARKFYRYGFYYFPALKKYPQLVLHHSAPRRSYFSIRALKHPGLLCGLILLYFVKAASAAWGAAISLIKRNKA